MQTECPHRRFYRLDAIRDELSPQAAERLDRIALFDRHARRWRPQRRAGRIRALPQRLPAASGARTNGAHAGA